MSLNVRHRAVTLIDKDGRINCPGGGTLHMLDSRSMLYVEGHASFFCEACKHQIFLLRGKHGVIDAWEILDHEVQIMERERMTDARQILEFLNRGAKRLDRV